MNSNLIFTVIGLFIGIVLCLGIYFAFLKTEPETIIETVTEVKTITKIDTVFIDLEKPIIVEVPIQQPVVEDSTNRYDNPFVDEFIDGTITTWTTGTITRQIFEYEPLFPKYIHRVDSVFTNTTTTITRNHYPKSFYLGGEFNQQTISPQLYYVTRSYAVGYKYNFHPDQPKHSISFLIKF